MCATSAHHTNTTLAITIHRPGVRIAAFGPSWKEYKDLNWSLGPFYAKPQNGTVGENTIATHIAEIARNLNITEILLPEPVFGVDVCIDEMLPDTVRLHTGNSNVTLRFGMKADICRLRLGQTYGFAPGGCPGVILYYPGNRELELKPLCVAAHVGRDSLFDRAHTTGRHPERKHESVIFAMWQPFARLPKTELRKIQATVAFALPPRMFVHSPQHFLYGADNTLMFLSLRRWHQTNASFTLDLVEVIRGQLMHCGVSKQNISTLGSDIAGDPARWHTTRNPDQSLRNHRNLLLITHTL